MYEPLHHKYRPQTFAQLVGQGAIADTLTHALQQSRIAPAYLFCGPRGTGKTSSARILAKSLNCLAVDAPTAEPCGECDVCRAVNQGSALDIVEIDAASNTGVDNIRELIERAQFAPVQCRYKLFVLDEVHMLSTAAFNALLKTLEEPPDRVVFVLATTDPQRVLPTIISRCQRFDFRRIPLPAMIKHLGYIATEEDINIAEAATQLVAQISQGGLRDAESLLDQLSLQADEITVETVWDLVGAVPERDLLNLIRAIAADDGPALIERVRHLMDKGREPLIVLQSLVGFYRDLLIAKSAPARADLVAITPPTWAEMTEFAKGLPAAHLLAAQQKLQTSEVQVKNTTQPRLWLEITLTGLLPSALGAAASLTTAGNGGSAASRSVLSVANPTSPRTSAPRTSTPRTSTSRTVTPTAPPAGQPTATPTTQPTTQPVASVTPEPVTAEPAVPEPVTEKPSKDVAKTSSEPSADAATTEKQAVESGGTETPSTASSPVGPQSSESPPSPASPSAASDSLPSGDESATPPADANNSAEPDASPEVTFGSLDDLWRKILAALEPRGTQMLMNQQGTLLAYDGVGAKVGFRSASLQKMAQQRVPNLEKAFAAVFQRPIKVSLEVISPEAIAPTNQPDQTNQPSASPNHSSTPPPRPNPLPSDQPTTTGQQFQPPSEANPAHPKNGDRHHSRQNSSDRTNPAPPETPPASTQKPTNAQSQPPQPADHLPSAPSAGAGPEQWQSNQEQDNIKRFAQFFNGQIVNLDEDEDSQNSGKGKPSSDPGPDVPF